MTCFYSIRDFITYLENKGKLVRINHEISTFLEITEISRRTLAAGGPALLFEKVTNKHGHSMSMPVLTNLFGTVERVAMAITTNKKVRYTKDDLREVGEWLAFLRQPSIPKGLKEVIETFPMIKSATNMRTTKFSAGITGKVAPCQEVVISGNDIDLNLLPIQTCWPQDISPLITWPLVISKSLNDDGSETSVNVGIYRLQVLDQRRLIVRWLKHRGGAQHYRQWKSRHSESSHPLPIAIVIGTDPATLLAAVTPVPENISELSFAGLLRGTPTEMVNCKTVPLQVPANAEIVIEGTVSLDHYEDEGPFGDHTGFYNSVEKFPVFTATAITTRKFPIYLSTYTGKPPDEPSILGESLNEVFIPLIQVQYPEIHDFWLPPEGCSYRIAVVSIKKSYPGHAKRIMMGIWSFLKQFIYTKWVIVVDENINIRDWKEVWWTVSTRVDPMRDITMIDNTPIDYLDFASPMESLGSKIGIDATNKIPPETTREWGVEINMSDDIIQKIDSLWDELSILGHKEE